MPSNESSAAEEVAYTLIGFAVLGFQRVQVKRRQVEREVKSVAKSFARHTSEHLDDTT